MKFKDCIQDLHDAFPGKFAVGKRVRIQFHFWEVYESYYVTAILWMGFSRKSTTYAGKRANITKFKTQ